MLLPLWKPISGARKQSTQDDPTARSWSWLKVNYLIYSWAELLPTEDTIIERQDRRSGRREQIEFRTAMAGPLNTRVNHSYGERWFSASTDSVVLVHLSVHWVADEALNSLNQFWRFIFHLWIPPWFNLSFRYADTISKRVLELCITINWVTCFVSRFANGSELGLMALRLGLVGLINAQ